MRIFTACNDTQGILRDAYFLESMPWDLEPDIRHIEEPSDGNFKGMGYGVMMQRKMEGVLSTLQSHPGELLLISDVDIVLAPGVPARINELMSRPSLHTGKPLEILFQAERPTNPRKGFQHRLGASEPNCGFQAVRSTPNTIQLYRDILGEGMENPMWDQGWLCDNLNTPRLEHLGWGVLPPEEFSSKTNGGLTNRTLIYHANCTVGSNGLQQKITQLNQALAILGTSLAVASFKEDTSWLSNPNQVFPSTLYSTGNDLSADVLLPNRGREAGQYLSHIIKNYGRFYPYEVFCQGDPFFHCRDILARLHRGEHLGKRFHWLTSRINKLGFTNNNHSLWHHEHDKAAYTFAREFLGGYDPNMVWGCGAQFSVSRKAIMNRPLEYWERLYRKVISEPLAPWAMERLWEHVF